MQSIKNEYQLLLSRIQDPKKSAWGSTAASPAGNTTSEIVNFILTQAVLHRASDIHLEPRHGTIIVRFRIDGVLFDVLDIKETGNINILPRIKILANIPTDSASSRKSWDGRFSSDVGGQKFDFRVATFPTILGDKIAIRVLNKNSSNVDLKIIGLSPNDFNRLERIIQRKSGLVIVSGPTGGGKTTTLYSVLRRLHTPSVNIVTLEDPVEYQIDGINQCDLKQKGKGDEDFISGLKSILRQDPDIILIGEIRDQDSADIAVRASITGHLVFTSLHANSAIGTVIRLVNMGLERHVVSYALIGTIAQRLVRRICENCRVPHTIDSRALNNLCENFGIDPALFSLPVKKSSGGLHYLSNEENRTADSFTFYKSNGCQACNGTGYKGRIGVFEVLNINEEIRDAIINKATASEIEALAIKDGFQSMAVDAIEKAKAGLITIDDIYPILLEKSS